MNENLDDGESQRSCKRCIPQQHCMLASLLWQDDELYSCFRVRGQSKSKLIESSRLEQRAHGVVVSHPLRMRKALGSNPSVSISFSQLSTKNSGTHEM